MFPAASAPLPDLLESLNPEQRHAVTHEGGALLVLAGAGTGKTQMLTTRFAWLVQEGVSPDRIEFLQESERGFLSLS